MVSSDNAYVEHLVVDTAAFVKRASLLSIGKKFYTTPSVLSEVRDKSTREYLKNLPIELIVREPTPDSLKLVVGISKKTGDYASLSAADLKVIALVYDLHVEHCGKDSINYDILPTTTRIVEKPAGKDEKDEDNDDFGDLRENAEDSEQSDGEWITADNFTDTFLKYDGDAVSRQTLKDPVTVGCITADFSIQNMMMHMKLKIISLDGLLIKHLKSYVLRCRACFNITSVMSKEFCPKCGNKSLDRVSVSVDDDGTQHLHIDFERLRVKRGLKYSIPLPKGGKHNVQEKLFEDQRLPQNRMARVKAEDNLDIAPFVLNDVSSRSAHLGIRSIARSGGRSPRNPNESAGTRRKKK